MQNFTHYAARGLKTLSLFSPQKHFLTHTMRFSLLLVVAFMSSFTAWAEEETFDFTGSEAYDMTLLSGTTSKYNDNPTVCTEGNITLTLTGNTRWWKGTNNHLRIYSKATLQFAAPTGYNITKIAFASTESKSSLSSLSVPTGGVGTYSGSSSAGTWTGSSNSVEIAATATVKITTITVTYSAISTTACAEPVITPASQSFVEDFTATITCSTDGATIYYTTDGTDPTTSSSVYSDGVLISGETTTLKAMACAAGLDNSSVVTAEYTYVATLDGLSALRAAIKADNDKNKTYYVKHSKLYVTRGNSSNYYMQDNDCGVLLYGCSVTTGTSYEEGLATVQGCMYNGQVELTSFSTTGTAGEDETEPMEVAFDELYSDLTSGESMYESMLVTVVKATVDADVDFSSAYQGTISQDEQTITIYRRGTVKLSLSADQVIDVTGIACPFTQNSKVTPEIVLYRASDVTTYAAVELKAQDTDGAYYATYYDDEPFIASGDVITYTLPEACVSDGVLYTKKFNSFNTGAVVPAKTAVLLCATDGGTYYFKHTTSSAKAEPDNLLHGNDGTSADADGNIQMGDGYLYYMLSYDNQDKNLGFYWGAADGGVFTNGANKAFLAVSAEQAAGAKGIVFSNGTVNSIKNIETSANSDATYSISGVRMNSNNLPAGIYVRGGKKFIVK